MEDFNKLVIKLLKHEAFSGMSRHAIENHCDIGGGYLGKIIKGDRMGTWTVCQKLAEACSVDLHVVASELPPEEAARRRETFNQRRNKRIDDNAKKQKKSLIKG